MTWTTSHIGKPNRGVGSWYRMMLVIIFEQMFLFSLSVMLEADPT